LTCSGTPFVANASFTYQPILTIFFCWGAFFLLCRGLPSFDPFVCAIIVHCNFILAKKVVPLLLMTKAYCSSNGAFSLDYPDEQ
jgi:hypothetical protein